MRDWNSFDPETTFAGTIEMVDGKPFADAINGLNLYRAQCEDEMNKIDLGRLLVYCVTFGLVITGLNFVLLNSMAASGILMIVSAVMLYSLYAAFYVSYNINKKLRFCVATEIVANSMITHTVGHILKDKGLTLEELENTEFDISDYVHSISMEVYDNLKTKLGIDE